MKIKSHAHRCLAIAEAEMNMYLGVAAEFADDAQDEQCAWILGMASDALRDKQKLIESRVTAERQPLPKE